MVDVAAGCGKAVVSAWKFVHQNEHHRYALKTLPTVNALILNWPEMTATHDVHVSPSPICALVWRSSIPIDN